MGLWNNPRLLALAANMLLGLGLAVTLIASLSWLANRPYFELRQIQLGAAPGSALRHVNKPTLVDAVRRAPAGNFFTVDMNDLKEAVQEVPWVRKATVRRLWPDTLVVSIEEHRAAALWEDSRLVSIYGELFSANLDEATEDGPLPQLGGPDGTATEVMARYVEMKSIFEPLGVTPVAVNLSARRAWTAKLEDGTELIIGKDKGVAIEERLSRWAESYPLVAERLQRKASVVDLRYPNGYAVRSLNLLADASDVDDLMPESGDTTGLAVKAALTAPLSKPKTSTKARPKAKKKPAPEKSTSKPKRKPVSKKQASKKEPVARPKPAPAFDASEDPLAEIRRAATRRAAERYAERAREAAKARRKALNDKRSSNEFRFDDQPLTMRPASSGPENTVNQSMLVVGEYA